jgi:hypothetical protein
VVVQICQIMIMLAYGCHYFSHLRFFRLRLMLLVLCAAVMVIWSVSQGLAAWLW